MEGPCWAAVSRAQVGQAGLPPGGCPGTACWDAGSGRGRWAARAAVWLHVEVQAGAARGSGRGRDCGARRLVETSGRGLPAVGRSLHLRIGLYLKWLLLVWCQALPRGGAASPDSSVSRCVWIEKESINSVIISDSPEDVHQRLLVAASLSVNTTGERGAPPALTPPPPVPPPAVR